MQKQEEMKEGVQMVPQTFPSAQKNQFEGTKISSKVAQYLHPWVGTRGSPAIYPTKKIGNANQF